MIRPPGKPRSPDPGAAGGERGPDAWKDFGLLWRHLSRHAGWLVASGASMLVFAATTASYAWLVGPVLRFVFLPDEGAPDLRGVPESAWLWLQDHRTSYPLLLAALVLALAVVRGLAQFGRSWFMGLVGQRVQLDLRQRVYDRMLGISVRRLLRLEKGDLSSRVVSDVVVLEYAITHGLSALLGDTVQVAALLALALWLDPVLGLVSLAVLPFSSLLIVWLGKRIRGSQIEAMEALGKLSSALVETARGHAVIRSLGAEEHARRRFRSLNDAHYGRVLRSVLLGALSSPLMEIIAATALAATLWWARVRILGDDLTPDRFVSFFAAVFLLYRPVKNLGGLNALINRGLAAAHRVFGFLDGDESPRKAGAEEAPPLETSLHLEGVSFSYGDGRVLDAVDLELEAGRVTALVGASGSGKTTLGAIVVRLLEPDSGRVTWDGIDTAGMDVESLRRRISYAPQDPFLFHESIRANLAVAAPDAPEQDMRAALAAADALAFVERLPGGLEEVVGEEGLTLSGGERQRICLARALLRPSDVLVVDEATSSVDAQTEERIREGMAEHIDGRTVLVIAHRLGTIRRADAIAVLDDGRIVERGTYEQLVRPGTRFHALFADQIDAGPGGIVPAEGPGEGPP